MNRTQASPETKILTRALSSSEAASSLDTENRTLRFAFSSPRPVERWAWFDELPEGASTVFNEVLPTDAAAWNLERVEQGVCPFLKNHSRNQKLGGVVGIDFGDDFVYATAKLRKTAESDQLITDVSDGLGGGISFGYAVTSYKVLTPAVYEGEGWDRKLVTKATLEATEIILYEVSSEEVPADPSIGSLKMQTVNLRTVAIEGDPGWELEVRATPDELKKGDWVAWNSSGGTAKGRIETVATSGSVQAVPKGPSMEGSPEQPAYLVVVWQEETDGWMATDVKVVKRASALTEIASLKKSAVSSQQSAVTARSQQRKPKEKPVGKRRQAKPDMQTRELALADYLTADSPTLSDLTTALEDTLAAIDDAASTDDTIDTTALYQAAIDDLCDQLYTIYDVPDPDAAEDAAETDTPMMTGEKTVETEKPTPQETERDRQFKAMEAKLQLMERRDTVTRKFTTLRQKAEALKSAGKLTPAEFKDKFGDVDAAIDLYTKADDSKINGLEERLNDIEKYAPAVDFGSLLKNEPLEVPETRSEYDAELEDYQKSKGRN